MLETRLEPSRPLGSLATTSSRAAGSSRSDAENSCTDSETVQDARRLTVVKNLQRQLPDTRLRWAAFCVAHCQGTKDPGRHTKASLSRSLTSEIPHVNAFWVKIIAGVT